MNGDAEAQLITER